MTCVELKSAAQAPTCNETRKARKYQAPWYVRTDDPADGPRVVIDYMRDQGFTLGSPYAYGNDADPFSYLESITPSRLPKSVEWWLVMLGYSPLDEDQEKPDKQGNPTNDPLSWRQEHDMGFASWQTPVWKAWNLTAFPHPDCTAGATTPYTRPTGCEGPVVNSAGVVLDPPLMKDEFDRVWQITAYDKEWDDQQALDYMGRVNLFPVKYHDDLITYYAFKQPTEKFALATWKCTQYTARARYQPGMIYWEYSLEFRYRASGWYEEVLDRGIAARGAPGGATGTGNDMPATAATGSAPAMPVVDGIGRRVPELVLFDGGGLPIPAGEATEATGFYFQWLKDPTAMFHNMPFHLWTS